MGSGPRAAPSQMPAQPPDLQSAKEQAELLSEILSTIEPGADMSEMGFVHEVASSVRVGQLQIQEHAPHVADEAALTQLIATVEAIDAALKTLDALTSTVDDATAAEPVTEPVMDLLNMGPSASASHSTQQTDQQESQQELDLLDLLDLAPAPANNGVEQRPAQTAVAPAPRNCARQQSNTLTRSDSVDAFFMG